MGWKKCKCLWTPVFKKEDPHERGNYRLITAQVTVSKLFEQLLSTQLSYCFNTEQTVRQTNSPQETQ